MGKEILKWEKKYMQPRKEPKILVWDLEFKGSDNWRHELKIFPGYLLCYAGKELNNPEVKVLSRRQFPGKTVNDDRALVRAIGNELRDVDCHVFQYGTKIDFRFIQTKLLQYGFRTLPEPPVFIDTCTVARQKLALSSNSMRTQAEFFKLREKKRSITRQEWDRAFALEDSVLKLVEARCASDVRITEQLFHRLKKLVHNHPVYKRFWNNGIRATAKTQYRRKHCKNCGVANFEVLKKK